MIGPSLKKAARAYKKSTRNTSSTKVRGGGGGKLASSGGAYIPTTTSNRRVTKKSANAPMDMRLGKIVKRMSPRKMGKKLSK